MHEVRFSGFGGQGIVRCALITGKALSMYDDKFATMTQSFGPEARGGACSSQLVVSESRILYPYVTLPGVLIALSQDSYTTYEPKLKDGGVLIYEADLVTPKEDDGRVQMYPAPVTRFAEELGNRLFANLVTLGCFSAITKIVTPEAMKKALPGLVPDRFLEVNKKAFDKGYAYGLESLEKKPLVTGDAQ
ncbi:MAG: 2-oxoacid:acceptor oxidoreductase family protein [gamma proteobacterium endosymbiont of Lamellibrachia anaximandri]|nr:2-oxoacid:acceptor oxidoreductase family protein [gamma proteobacterium endosymbiont of Lamellibrachia anaximandri]MBL3534433.1 2-oxoacid:acceptor oxidoreductase family protein [gamma proteobacterium endosymbiont of Lamellibrachia anaximandri]MBL3600055.1 2-oxoacid:acceptor oxidoreductase family protein [gamma proteobacterium endosymbiont of Lamellibrachia anaximandri]